MQGNENPQRRRAKKRARPCRVIRRDPQKVQQLTFEHLIFSFCPSFLTCFYFSSCFPLVSVPTHSSFPRLRPQRALSASPPPLLTLAAVYKGMPKFCAP